MVSAEFHPLEPRTIVAVGKGFVNFWQLDQTSLTLSRKTGIFDQRDKPKYVTCLSFASNGDVITGMVAPDVTFKALDWTILEIPA